MGRGSSKPAKWWHARSSMEKTLLTFSIIITLSFIIVIIIGATTQGVKSTEEEEGSSSCLTPECLIKAAKVLDMLNSSIDPCNDFYAFSCDHYVKTHPVLVDNFATSVGQTTSDGVRLYLKQWLDSKDESNSSSFENAKLLFKICMKPENSEEDYKDTVYNLIRNWKIGNWPILDPHFMDSDVNLGESLGNLTLLGIPVVFNLKVIQGPQKNSNTTIQISPGGPLLNFLEEQDVRESSMLKSYIKSILLLLGAKEHSVSNDVEEILSIESVFIRLKQKADDECGRSSGNENTELTSAWMSIKEMNERIHEIRWDTLLSNLIQNINSNEAQQVHIDIKGANVFCRKYIREYINHLDQLPTREIYNYLGWRFLFNFVQHLGPPFYRLHSDYQNYISKEVYRPLYRPRWKECLSLVERYFLPVLAKIYKEKKNLGPVIKEKMKIASDVRQSFTDLLSSTKWIKNQDQQKIKQKVLSSKFDIALLKISSNWEKIDTLFENLSLNSSHGLLDTVLQLQRHEVINELLRLHDPSRESREWVGLDLTTPYVEKFQENSIPVYFDKLIPPYFQLGGPSYSNYGVFGSYLSRELLQYLSYLNISTTVGSKKLNIFWEVPRRNNDLSHCFPDTILPTEILQLYDGKLVQMAIDAVLSELGAVYVSHLTYQNHRSNDDINLFQIAYSHEQLFFISYAQALCEVNDSPYSWQIKSHQFPSSIRVNFALKNFPSFAKAFNCPSESPMNPSLKCHILD